MLNLAGRRFHFIGAGGVGMSGLAKLLIKNNALVSGSDQSSAPVISRLCRLGADIKIGHSPDNLDPKTDAVVVSAAIEEDNPELKLARRRGCKIYKYAQMLGELMNIYDGIAVSGTHGKSTTGGWLVYLLQQAGIEPNFIIGADIIQLAGSSGTSQSNYFVAEACEYDRSFLNLEPKIAAILNIEADHLDYYKDENEIVDAFGEFARHIKTGGALIFNVHDPNVTAVTERLAGTIDCRSFGFDKACDFSAQNIRLIDGLHAFELYHKGKLLGEAQISLPGRHNILNALAVAAIAVNMGLDAGRIPKLLSGFTGVDRRLMLKARLCEITVLDDYAHHPTEIRASLEAIRLRYQLRRLWCVFQPHQYSRTRFLLDDFAESFKLADITIVPDIYFVRDTEAARTEVNSQVLVERIRANGTEAFYIENFEKIGSYLRQNVTAGDLVVTMGAGDIWKVADEYIQWFGKNC